MSDYGPLESILVVFQNHVEGRRESYDDWYTNVHIRDAMRLDGAIATQRFIVGDGQPVLNGERVTPAHWAHTIYEWESARKSVDGHHERAGTPAMQISSDGRFDNLRDYFFRPVWLSDGWTREAGFRRGKDVLTALIIPPAGGEDAFVDWFTGRHAPDTLALPGFASVGLFSLHEDQSLPIPCRYPFVAIYALSDVTPALAAWNARHAAGSALDLTPNVAEAEITCWQPRIQRLRAEEVLDPSPLAASEENRAKAAYADRYLSQEELGALLDAIRAS